MKTTKLANSPVLVIKDPEDLIKYILILWGLSLLQRSLPYLTLFSISHLFKEKNVSLITVLGQ